MFEIPIGFCLSSGEKSVKISYSYDGYREAM